MYDGNARRRGSRRAAFHGWLRNLWGGSAGTPSLGSEVVAEAVAEADPGGVPDASSRAEEERVLRVLQGLAPPRQLPYGPADAQSVDLYMPEERLLATHAGLPTVLLVHGGFFKNKWSRRNTQTTTLVPFFLERGARRARRGRQPPPWPR